MTVFGALRASPPSSTTVATASIWAWIFCFMLFWDVGVVTHFTQIRFYKTDDVTHSSLYTEQLLSAHALVQTGLCTEKLLQTDAFTQRFSRKEAFTHRNFYTPMLYTKMHLHSAAFANRRLYTQTLLLTDAFTHRSFYTEKPLHRTAFTWNSFPLPLTVKKTGKQVSVFELGSFSFPVVSLPDNKC